MHRRDSDPLVMCNLQFIARNDPVTNGIELVIDNLLICREEDHLPRTVRERLEYADALDTAQAGQWRIDDEGEGPAADFRDRRN